MKSYNLLDYRISFQYKKTHIRGKAKLIASKEIKAALAMHSSQFKYYRKMINR
jgi:rhodanese-related sulfurtransferase